MAVIERAGYRVQVPLKGPLTDARLQEAINLLLEKKSIIIYRRTKRGSQEKDIREGIYHLTGEITAKEAALQMELGIAGKLAVRPEEIVQLLAEEEALPLEPKMARIERTGLFVFKEGRRLSPLEDLDR